jgi:tetratricopeptide (TPR) repeat protein
MKGNASMELTLTRQSGNNVAVICDGQPSHTFDLRILIPNSKNGLPQPLDNPITYGKAIYSVLFPPETPAQFTLEAKPEHILLVTSDNELDAVPWEYVCSPDGFVVLDCQFVRGLPAEERIDYSVMETGLHIVAIPSNPLEQQIAPLNIDGEWMRLKEIIQEVPFAITLERTRPPTLEQVRRLIANQRHRVLHFMGHGGVVESGAVLLFEQNNGDPQSVTAKDFIRRIRGTVFLVTLNACASASPGSTVFSNLAAALVRQKTPYALGMRFSIMDEDARAFSRVFYSELARGVSIEEAMFQARLTLAQSSHAWAFGVPVLYTALKVPVRGFRGIAGTPTIKEHQPALEVSTLPRVEGIFQGRIDELKLIGESLTGDDRPRLVTIHGSGGQGKTALAREAVERFAYAWPGGVWATTLEGLPSRELFVNELARFLGISTSEVADLSEIERQVVAKLRQHRTLIVLDNAETLVDAIESDNETAVRLAQFIREQLPSSVSLLATSRSYLGWSGEIGCELEGLAPGEGARLFKQNVPRWTDKMELSLARELSQKVEGHPLSLRLLGSAFNASTISFLEFVEEYESHLVRAENKYAEVDHRHRTLYASIETSVRYLDVELRELLSGLWVFHAPFLAQTAAAIFDPNADNAGKERSPVYDQLFTLWQRGLLTNEMFTVPDRTFALYQLLPTMRPYIEQYLDQVYEREELQAKFGEAYSQLARSLHREMDRIAAASIVALEAREDLERGVEFITGVAQADYLLHLGEIMRRLGNTRLSMELSERALEIAQGHDRVLEIPALNNLANIYRFIGQPRRALALFSEALSIEREVGTRVNETFILQNMAVVYSDIGESQRALAMYEEVLPMMRESGDKDSETTILTNMAVIYHETGQPQRALALFEEALPIKRESGDRAGVANLLSNMAVVYNDTGQPRRALVLFEEALQIMLEIGNRVGEAQVLNNMASVYNDMGQPQRALALYEKILPIRHEVGDRGGEAGTLNNMASVYHASGQPNQALALYEEALLILQEIEDRAGEATTLNNTAVIYSDLGQWLRAQDRFEKVLSKRRELGDRDGEATTLNNLGLLYQDVGQPQRALELFEEALLILHELGNRKNEAVTINNMALTYRAIGQRQRSLELYEQALPIVRELGDRAGEATMLNNMASIYDDMRQQERALELYKQALFIARELGHRGKEASTLNNIARVYEGVGQNQLALEFLEESLPILHEVNDRAGIATTLSNIAAVYLNTGQPQRALELYEKALPERSEVGDRAGVATTLTSMANLYREIGQLERAVELFEQALPIFREVGNRVGEATTLNNMAVVCDSLGESQRALELLEQALPIRREVGDREGEAATLANMAGMARVNQPRRALELFEQALPILREVGDREHEGTALNYMATFYQASGQPRRALGLYEQLLRVRRELGDRLGEAQTLNNIAVLYRQNGDIQKALELYEQALPVTRELGDRESETATLTNMALVYRTMGQFQRALELFQQVLQAWRDMGHRTGEAATLNNMALVYQETGKPQEALELYEQALTITHELGIPAQEVVTLNNIAWVLYKYLGRSQEAIIRMEQAIAMLVEAGLPQDASGQTVDDLRQYLENMLQATAIDRETSNKPRLTPSPIQDIADNTVAAMTVAQNLRTGWHKRMEEALLSAQQGGTDLQNEVDFFTAILAILEGQAPVLPADHPFASTVTAIQADIVKGGQEIDKWPYELVQVTHTFISASDWNATRRIMEEQQQLLFRPEVEVIFEQNIAQTKAMGNQRLAEILELHLALLRASKKNGIASAFKRLIEIQEEEIRDALFGSDLIIRSIQALSGGPQERMEHTQYLAGLTAQTTNEELKNFINVILLALFGGNLPQLSQNLSGVYQQAWRVIVIGVERRVIDESLFTDIIRNTVAVFGPDAEQFDEWRDALDEFKAQAMDVGAEPLLAFIDEIIELLDAS